MSDTFTETTSQGWFSRIGSSIKGVLGGVVLILLSVAALFWNEGRAVKTRKTLDEGAQSVVSITSESVDASQNGNLVHLSGVAKAESPVQDTQLGITTNALVLKREIEMYQWKETAKSETKKKLGGSEETVTTFTYSKEWASGRVDSSRFNQEAGHQNPELALSGEKWTADPIVVGAYTLSDGLARQIGNFGPLELPENSVFPEMVAGKKVQRSGAGFYLGNNPESPEVGDVKVSHQTAMPDEVSLIAKVRDSSFEPYVSKVGGSIQMLTMGEKSAEEMFQTAQESNKTMTWIIRGVGVLVMFFGFSALLRPLSVLADVVPFIGSIVGVGTGLIAALCTIPLSAVVIGIAWIFYRPLLGISLLIVAVAGIVFLVRKILSQRKLEVVEA